MREITKYGLSAKLEDFSQEQYELYQPRVLKAARDNYFDFGMENGGGLTANAVVRGVTIRAAIQAGFLIGITVEEVNKLKSYVAIYLANEIEQHVKDVTTPPPDPN